MLENKWNNIAPEVPQDFHEKFEETLRHIEQADTVNKNYKRKRISGRLLIAAAVICTGMGVTVAAKEFFKWNDHLLKRLEPSEEQQETMQESNYIQNIDQSVTQNGVTVTLTDSIQDQGFLYAFFEVKTDDSISMPLSCGWIRSQGACGAFYFGFNRNQINMRLRHLISVV